MANVETGDANVDGTRLRYQIHGDGPPVLLLHGFALDQRMWRPQVEVLAARFRVITYDARGFGRSALPGEQPYRHADDAGALCDFLGIRDVVAIGHSIGAHQMLEFALSRPDLVAGFGAVCMSGLAGVPFTNDLQELFKGLREKATEGGVESAKRLWLSAGWFAPARERPEVAPELDAILADYSGWHWTHQNPVRNIEPPAAERLAELDRPVLLFTGERDLPYNHEVSARLRASIPHAVHHTVSGAGHMANLESPDFVNGAIEDWLRSMQRP